MPYGEPSVQWTPFFPYASDRRKSVIVLAFIVFCIYCKNNLLKTAIKVSACIFGGFCNNLWRIMEGAAAKSAKDQNLNILVCCHREDFAPAFLMQIQQFISCRAKAGTIIGVSQVRRGAGDDIYVIPLGLRQQPAFKRVRFEYRYAGSKDNVVVISPVEQRLIDFVPMAVVIHFDTVICNAPVQSADTAYTFFLRCCTMFYAAARCNETRKIQYADAPAAVLMRSFTGPVPG